MHMSCFVMFTIHYTYVSMLLVYAHSSITFLSTHTRFLCLFLFYCYLVYVCVTVMYFSLFLCLLFVLLSQGLFVYYEHILVVLLLDNSCCFTFKPSEIQTLSRRTGRTHTR